MPELWIPLTFAAAFFQNLRSALQKHLKSRLSTAGAAYVRFFYAWPFAVVYCWALARFGGFAVPEPNPKFLLYCFLGGLSQIIFTFLLLWLFSFRNFAVGTTYSKTETAQVAILGLLILGDTLSVTAVVAIAVSLVGVFALSVVDARITVKNLFTGLAEKPTLIGLVCGAFLGASVVLFRGGALALGNDDFLMRAAFTLAVSVVMQTLMMGGYLLWREPGQMTAVVRNWRPALSVGVAGVLASIFWFSAFTLENAALVRAVGQIELVFTFIASAVFFRERTKMVELVGIALIVGGILILVLGR
ncbi:MAG: DMT family transporter [Rhodospirillales bacterium]|nr:DMT family transporter [Rhodospirillales bacterium]MBI3113424.1 DMT family transporter [Rhodospirillales bacterium]